MAEQLCIGNDIVALPAFPLLAPRYKRTLRKIMTDDEISEGASVAGDLMLPLYFSCKESAYKHFVKKGLRKAFCAHRYRVRIQQSGRNAISGILFFRGSVTYNDISCEVTAEVNPGKYIHSCCFSKHSKLNYRFFINRLGPEKKNTDDSLEVRKEMIRNLREFKYQNSDIEIFNDSFSRIPGLKVDGRCCSEDLSMSHDGSYIAGVFTENPATDE